ncbi:MAG: hypothetical protein JNL17_01005 [Cyclobacteriaceae bacterium]|nr:hypothetical protein [Cyclobacteriaceae bacterium]
MKDQLTRLVEANAGKAIVQNEAIPNQFNQAAIEEVANGIINTMKGQVNNGNSARVVEIFQRSGSNPSNENAVINEMISSVTNAFSVKFGVSANAATNAVSGLIPTVMRQLIQKTNDPADHSFEMNDVLASLAGDPIQQSFAGDPIQQSLAGDPIQQSFAGDPIQQRAAGDPIQQRKAGDPIQQKRGGDPIQQS